MKWLELVLGVLVRALLPALVEAARPKAEDSRPDTALRRRLRDGVRRHWFRAAAAGLAFIVVIGTCGCNARTIYVPDGTPVRLRETIRAAKVWVLDAEGRPVAGVMDLPEGWYALPVPEEQ
ncbi:MAG TPA: hypothetical protein VMY69_01905 [Phycisphaerae bacterium]|nr:hypothetical protein [Phycisphaerae bacterium]